MESSAIEQLSELLPWGGVGLAMGLLGWWAARHFGTRRLDRVVSGEGGYSAVMDALSDGVLIYGKDGCVKACNPAAGRLFGRDPKDLIGTTGLGPGWTVEDEAGRVLGADDLSAGPHPADGGTSKPSFLKVASPDGQSRWFRRSAAALPPSQTFGDGATVAKLRDVTEQRREAAALREAEAGFRKLFESFPTAASITRAEDGLLVEVNEAWCHLFGWTRGAALGRTVLDLGIWSLPGERENLLRSLQAARVLRDWPLTMAREDGSMLQVGLGVATVQVNGETCLLTVLEDHTGTHQAMRARTKQEKAESLGLMAAGLSHDFNNLFQSLLTSLELAHSRSDASNRHFLDRALLALERASAVSRQLLEFSGGSFTSIEAFSLHALMHEVMDAQSERPGVRVEMTLATGLPRIRADREQVRRILGILLENAIEAMGPREGVVTLATEHIADMSEVDQNLGHWAADMDGGPKVRLTIRDAAGGVDPARVDYLFDPGVTTKGMGRGLGLSAALGLVRGNRGGLQVLNRPGEGMTFHIYLPTEHGA